MAKCAILKNITEMLKSLSNTFTWADKILDP